MAGIDSNTKLMLHMDGSDGSTTFTDDGTTGHSPTANGNAQIDTAQSKFGGASGLFDGTGDYVSVTDHADWDFGSGDFTIDLWVRWADISGNQTLVSAQTNAQDDGFSLVREGGDLKIVLNATTELLPYTWAPSVDTWYHIAVVRETNTWYLFVAGVQQATTSSATTILSDSAITLKVGSGFTWSTGPIRWNNASDFDFNGWIEEVRISKGVARWNSGFTPPTVAYSVDSVIIPSTLSISSTLLAPTIAIDNIVISPSALAITATLPVPVAGAITTITPSVLSISSTLLAPAIAIDNIVISPSAIAITASVLAPTVIIHNILTLEADLPVLTLEARIPTSLNLEATLPTLALEASCKTGQLLTMTGNLPILTLESHMGMHMVANLPALTLSSALTVGGVMSLIRTLPALTLEASMTSGRILTLTANLAALTLSANLVNGNILTLAQTLPALTLEALGTTGNNMSLTQDLPVLTLVSTVSSSENLTLTATLPALKLEAFADNYLQRYI